MERGIWIALGAKFWPSLAPETYGAPAVLLLGPHGMGKTALLASALESLPEGWRALALSAASAETEPQLLAQLALSLGLDLDLERPTPVLWRELEDEMAARLELGERVLLTVDDADLMDDDALGALLEHFAPFLSPAARLVLAGPSALEGRFDATLREYELDLSVELMSLSSLSEPSTAAYVSQRWEAASAGGKARRAPGSAELARIHLLSGGIPGAINEAARSILLAQRGPWRLLLALMGVAALLAFSITLWTPIRSPNPCLSRLGSPNASQSPKLSPNQSSNQSPNPSPSPSPSRTRVRARTRARA